MEKLQPPPTYTTAYSRVAKISQGGEGAFFEVWYNPGQTWPKFSLVLN